MLFLLWLEMLQQVQVPLLADQLSHKDQLHLNLERNSMEHRIRVEIPK